MKRSGDWTGWSRDEVVRRVVEVEEDLADVKSEISRKVRAARAKNTYLPPEELDPLEDKKATIVKELAALRFELSRRKEEATSAKVDRQSQNYDHRYFNQLVHVATELYKAGMSEEGFSTAYAVSEAAGLIADAEGWAYGDDNDGESQ